MVGEGGGWAGRCVTHTPDGIALTHTNPREEQLLAGGGEGWGAVWL